MPEKIQLSATYGIIGNTTPKVPTLFRDMMEIIKKYFGADTLIQLFKDDDIDGEISVVGDVVTRMETDAKIGNITSIVYEESNDPSALLGIRYKIIKSDDV